MISAIRVLCRLLYSGLFGILLSAFPVLTAGGQSLFTAPLDTPLYPTGSFAELRPAHFHAGIDFGTDGKVGRPVYASAQGWISRIKVSPSGYGRVIYIDHPGGFTTVYAHLHALRGDFSAYVDSARLTQKMQEAELFPDSGRFVIGQGDLIGYSGNSGSSQGPHLHFEIRERKSQDPVDPNVFNRFFVDTIKPQLSGLALYGSEQGYFPLLEVFAADSPETLLAEAEEDTVFISVLAWDPGTKGRNGVADIRLFSDDSLVFHYRPERFSFNETRFANAHSDVIDFSGSAQRFHRLHVLPGDTCSIYRNAGSGAIALNAESDTEVRIEVMDAAGNRTGYRFKLRSAGSENTLQFERSFIIEYNKPWRYSRGNGLEVTVPAGALYQHAVMDSSILMEEVYDEQAFIPVLTALDVPLHRAGRFYLPLGDNRRKAWQKLMLMVYENPRSKTPEAILPDSLDGNRLVFPFRKGGWFLPVMDTVPPQLTQWGELNDPVDAQLRKFVVVSDSLSGVRSVAVYINEEWVLSDADTKSGRVEWKPSPDFTGPSLVRIELSDRCGNARFVEWAY